MRKLFTIFVLLCTVKSFGQASDSVSMTTYDTTYIYHYDPYHTFNCYMRITRPTNLFTAGSPDTASRPLFLMMPGQGEMNSSPGSLTTYGPHYFLANGLWHGVTIGNGTHFPILITETWDVNPPEPPLDGVAEVLSYLIRTYHVNKKAVHLMGLSEGSFTFCGIMGLDIVTDTVMKMVTSLNPLSGAATTTGNFTEFGKWAKRYGGHAFLTVGYQDAQTTNPPLLAENMDDSVPGSAYFSYNTIDGGNHGGWNTDWDPTLVLWNSVTTPLGTYVTNSTKPNLQGTYKSPESIFQWMLRQGDTTLVEQATLTIKKTIPTEYWHMYIASNDTGYAIFNSTNVVPLPLPGSRLMQDAAGCFNFMRVCATDGTAWRSPYYNSDSSFSTTPGAWWTQIPTDSTGASITNAISMFGYANNYIMMRSDSSLWFGGADDFGIFHSSGGVEMRPYKMTTGSQKFKKAVLCAYGVWAISSDGLTVYNWASGSGTSPTTYTFSGQGTGVVLDIAANNGNPFSNAIFVIIQQTTGSLYGHPYVLGNGYSFWGSGTSQSFSSFTDLYSQWGLSSLVASIVVNSNTTHFIDSLGNLYGTGFNMQGEVGNGVEYVNRYNYPSWPNYGWNFVQSNPITTGVVQIGSGHKYSHLYTNGFFTFYNDVLDVNNNLYQWGRNKTAVLAVGPNGTRTGVLDFADNPNNANAQDVLSPTLALPFAQNVLTLNWTGPTISTPTQNITSASTALTLGGHPALLVNAALSTDTVNYSPVSYAWSQFSEPNTATFSSTTAKTPTVSGLTTGTYVFQVFTTDSNGGLNESSKTVNVSLPAPAGASYLILHRGWHHKYLSR